MADPLRILIACETSGIGRRAFAALGHDVWSCDLLPAEDGSTRREWWVETYGQDTDYLPVVADMLAGQFNSPWRRK